MPSKKKSVHSAIINGEVRAPASKSVMQRAVAASLLAAGRSRINNPSHCLDARASLWAAMALGAETIAGEGFLEIMGGVEPMEGRIDCGEAGLTLRMFIPIAALTGWEVTLAARGTLRSRPVGAIEPVIESLGGRCRTSNGLPPVRIRGPLAGGDCEADGSLTSQFISGLLLALPLTSGGTVSVTNLKSKPYIDLTMEVMERFGITVEHDDYRVFRIPGGQSYRPAVMEVPGDWSGAAFLLVAAAIGGEAIVSGLSSESRQADRGVLEALDSCGAHLSWTEDSLRVKSSGLRAFDFDAGDRPDLFPPLVALACHCSGRSRIAGVHRLAHKESDRAAVLAREFAGIGASIELDGDLMVIEGGRLRGGAFDPHRDHRMAMAAATAAVRADGPVIIKSAECVDKSYPDFYADLGCLGVRIDE